jgi:hypothetical protein
MIHTCNIHCHTMDLDRADLLGVDDTGKWLPFAFHMDIVVACKMTTDDRDEEVYNCTTIFTDHSDTYIIDTPYTEFISVFQMYHEDPSSSSKNDEPNF